MQQFDIITPVMHESLIFFCEGRLNMCLRHGTVDTGLLMYRIHGVVRVFFLTICSPIFRFGALFASPPRARLQKIALFFLSRMDRCRGPTKFALSICFGKFAGPVEQLLSKVWNSRLDNTSTIPYVDNFSYVSNRERRITTFSKPETFVVSIIDYTVFVDTII